MVPVARDERVHLPPPQGMWTVADWEMLPANGCRYEVIHGSLSTMTTAPSNFHQWIIGMFIEHLGVALRNLGRGVWFTAPVGLVVPPSIALQPDFLVILNQNLGIVRGGRIRGAPDLVVEVLSPTNTAKEMHEKRAAYAAIGVPEYVVVDPSSRTLTYYRLEASGATYDAGQVSGEGDTVAFACLPDVPLAVSALFADAPDTTISVSGE